MTTLNINLFDEWVTVILVTLYKEFPVQTELSFNDLDMELWEDEDSQEKHFEKHEVFEHTIK